LYSITNLAYTGILPSFTTRQDAFLRAEYHLYWNSAKQRFLTPLKLVTF